jgi:carbonic anhydrase/acetyltransferase-like protein (isoleucine patch superfamily)
LRLKPVPVTENELMVTGPVPVDDNVTVWFAVVLRATLPKFRLVVLRLSVAVDGEVPLSATAAVGLVDDVLLTVNWPVADPVVVGANCTLSVVDCPGFKVIGAEPPLRLKPVPATESELTVTGPVPVDDSVTVWVAVVLRATLPKFRLVVLRLSVAVDGEVPLSATTAVGLVDELLLTVSWPVAVPVVVGLNCTLSVVDCPGFRVIGAEPPLRLKPVPVTENELMVTGPVPVEDNVTVWVAVVLRATLPKFRLVVLRLSVGVVGVEPLS